MLHIFIGLYISSLFSGALVLSALGNNPKYRCTSGFKEFVALYIVITLFVFVTTICLYASVNLPTISAYAKRSYISFIFIFLGILPIATTQYNAIIYRFELALWLKTYVGLVAAYGVATAVIIWWLQEKWILYLILSSIAFMLIALVFVSWKARERYDNVFSSNVTKIVSRVMITQSLILPLFEGILFADQLVENGFTFSLPVVYFINNILLWKYRDYLTPGTGRPLKLKKAASLLSPKEREIAYALAKGLSNKQIAAQLDISPSTVKNHIYSIFKKCNVNNRVALVSFLQAD